MRNLVRTLLLALPLVGGLAGVETPATAQPVFVPLAPPPLQREFVPAPPGVGVVWRPGFWRWDGRQYFWEPGGYVAAPRHRVRWIPGHWVRRPGAYLWAEGRWR